jgi:hypothetical protein
LKKGVTIVLGSACFGLMMGLREEFSSALVRVLIAGLACGLFFAAMELARGRSARP